MKVQAPRVPLLRRAYGHLNNNLLAGFLVIIPLIITWVVVKFFFNLFTEAFNLLPIAPDSSDTMWRAIAILLAIVTMVAVLYLLGWLGRTVIGRRVVDIGHNIAQKIPLVQFIYKASREMVDALQALGKDAKKFNSVVLLEYPRSGVWTLGLVTSYITGPNGEHWVSVYIPTSPTPTSGMLAIIGEDQVIRINISVEECMRIVISGGLLSPSKIGRAKNSEGKVKVDEAKV